MYSQYLNEQFQLQSQEEKYDEYAKLKTQQIPQKQKQSHPQKSNKIDLRKISSITIDPITQPKTSLSNKEKKAISQLQKSNSRYLPKELSNHTSNSLNKRDTQFLKRDNQSTESTKLPLNLKVRSKDGIQQIGNNIEIRQFIDAKDRNKNYRSLSTHFMNKNKNNALKITNKSEQQKFNQQFYHSKQVLQQLSIEQITILSKRLKDKIKTLDNTLSQKVTKALKEFKQGTAQPQSPQKQYNLLKQIVLNNESLIQNQSFDYVKLQSKEGQLQEEYYELQLEKEVTKTMEKIRQAKRDILQMKKSVRTSSFQLNDSDIISKMTKKSNVLKLDLFKIRQQVELNEVKIEQFQAKKSEIQDKSYRLSQKHSSLLQEAKNKNIRLEPDIFLKKSLELKMRIDKSKQLRNNSENHTQRTINSLTIQTNHINNEIRQYEEDTKGIQAKINEIQKKAFTLIESNQSLLKNIGVNYHSSINYFQQKRVLYGQQMKMIKPILGIKALKEQQRRQRNQLKLISQSTQQQYIQKGQKIETPSSNYEENEFINLTQSKIKQLNPISKDQNRIYLPSSHDSRQQNQTQTAITKLSRKQKSKQSPKNTQNQLSQTHQTTFPRRFRLKKEKNNTVEREQKIGKQEQKK